MNYIVGKITNKVINILKLPYDKEEPVFIGESNMMHIKDKHPDDFKKYGSYIQKIIKEPTYLARNEKKKSIEFIKVFKENNDYVLVAIRVSNNKNIHFARTMYIMSKEKVRKYFEHNYFLKF